MKLSLIIPTIGRPDDLNRFIVHLQRQVGDRVNLHDLELLVVDQSGQPETKELLERQVVPFRIRHLPMPGRGASRARNYGWSFAQGEIICFPDDDCHYSPKLLEQVLEYFENPSTDGLMVQIENISRQDQTGGPIDRGNVLLRCAEAGFFVRRDRAGDIRYDERMGIGSDSLWNSDEGPDLLLRLIERGLRIDYAPEIWIHHPNPLQTLDQRLLERTFTYSRGRGYLYRKHRFPLVQVAKSLVRSLGGCTLMALTVRPYWARYYWNAFTGKWRGYCGGKAAPPQLLTSPLAQDQADETGLLATSQEPEPATSMSSPV